MLTIRGTYNNGSVSFDEKPPVDKKAKTLITFLETDTIAKKPRKAGGLKGQIQMSDDFNAPLEELKDYM